MVARLHCFTTDASASHAQMGGYAYHRGVEQATFRGGTPLTTRRAPAGGLPPPRVHVVSGPNPEAQFFHDDGMNRPDRAHLGDLRPWMTLRRPGSRSVSGGGPY